ncbi:MAG TPA: hypothetical protein VF600_18005 [Abditibacteriaceae bacterium]|jgi:hypothetical protein
MSRSQQAVLIDELWDETQRLNEQVASLQERLALYEDISYENSSSTRLTTLKAQARREEDAWDVWPYCWAIGAHAFFALRLHSFHEKLNEWRLSRRNKKERSEFWQQPHPEDISLKLM